MTGIAGAGALASAGAGTQILEAGLVLKTTRPGKALQNIDVVACFDRPLSGLRERFWLCSQNRYSLGDTYLR